MERRHKEALDKSEQRYKELLEESNAHQQRLQDRNAEQLEELERVEKLVISQTVEEVQRCFGSRESSMTKGLEEVIARQSGIDESTKQDLSTIMNHIATLSGKVEEIREGCSDKIGPKVD